MLAPYDPTNQDLVSVPPIEQFPAILVGMMVYASVVMRSSVCRGLDITQQRPSVRPSVRLTCLSVSLLGTVLNSC